MEKQTDGWLEVEMAEARRELGAVDARSLITDDLLARIRAAAAEIEALTREAEQIRERVENVWVERVRALNREHERLIATRFPNGEPEWVGGLFDEMTGNDALYDAFHTLLCMLHNAVPDYPNCTRDDQLPDSPDRVALRQELMSQRMVVK